MKSRITLVLAATCLLLPVVQAQPATETVSTAIRGQAAVAKGNHLRAQVNELAALIEAKKFLEAEQLATDLEGKFQSLFDPNMRHYSFQSNEEYLEFKDSSSQEFEWIDWGYKECLQMKAFLVAERRDFPTALAILGDLEEVAPGASSVAAERGYIFNQIGKPADALAAYQRALSLSTRYRSQRAYQAPALRGIGFALIELNRLDEAEHSLLESLKIEANNKVALSELAYIRNLRSKR